LRSALASILNPIIVRNSSIQPNLLSIVRIQTVDNKVESTIILDLFPNLVDPPHNPRDNRVKIADDN
jgi:hypothetical protein